MYMGASDPAGHLLVPIAPAESPRLVWGPRWDTAGPRACCAVRGRAAPRLLPGREGGACKTTRQSCLQDVFILRKESLQLLS